MRQAFLLLFALCAPALTHAQGTAERWTLVPELRIGSLDAPNYALSEITHLTIGPQGTLYVAQPMEGQIRVFDARGRFVRNIGRKGAGPGEFEDLSRLGWRADSLWAVDFMQQRVSFFRPEGQHLRTQRIQGPLLEISSRPTAPAGILADGSVLGLVSVSTRRVAEGGVRSRPLLRLDRSGRLLGTLLELDPRGGWTVLRMGEGALNYRLPVQSNSLWDLAPDGASLVLVHRPLPPDGREGRFRVVVVRPGGDTLFARSYRFAPKPVPAAVADSARTWLRDVLLRVGRSRQEAERLPGEAMQLPSYQAGITDVIAGRDRTVWLRREELGVGQVEWIVLDERAEIVGYFTTPASLRILQAQRGMVWGVEKDEFDVPYVVRYRVVRQR